MIKQKFEITSRPWTVYVYYNYNAKNINDVIDTLNNLYFPKYYVTRAYSILSKSAKNSGFTYTNLYTKTTLIVITQATNFSQFINSLIHEIFHLITHIAKRYDISFDNEELCYLAGDIAQRTYTFSHRYISKYYKDI